MDRQGSCLRYVLVEVLSAHLGLHTLLVEVLAATTSSDTGQVALAKPEVPCPHPGIGFLLLLPGLVSAENLTSSYSMAQMFLEHILLVEVEVDEVEIRCCLLWLPGQEVVTMEELLGILDKMVQVVLVVQVVLADPANLVVLKLLCLLVLEVLVALVLQGNLVVLMVLMVLVVLVVHHCPVVLDILLDLVARPVLEVLEGRAAHHFLVDLAVRADH